MKDFKIKKLKAKPQFSASQLSKKIYAKGKKKKKRTTITIIKNKKPKTLSQLLKSIFWNAISQKKKSKESKILSQLHILTVTKKAII